MFKLLSNSLANSADVSRFDFASPRSQVIASATLMCFSFASFLNFNFAFSSTSFAKLLRLWLPSRCLAHAPHPVSKFVCRCKFQRNVSEVNALN